MGQMKHNGKIVCFFLFVLLLYPIHVFGEKDAIPFFNSLSNKRFKIDLKNQQLLEENTANNWKKISALTFENIDPNVILPVYKFNVFSNKQGHWITIPGTGQVYLLNNNLSNFKRIDHSFHTGYNFQAVQFMRQDTLYSFGGYGFWQYHNILTYFDTNSFEWETYTQLEDGPQRFTNRFSCYSVKSDKVYALELPKPYLFTKTRKYIYWEFNFKSKTWKPIGQINSRLALILPESKLAGPYFLFKYQNLNLIADPEKNKVYVYDGPHSKLTDALDQEATAFNHGKIYSFQKFLIGNQVHYTIDSSSVDTLFKQSKFLFELIEPEGIQKIELWIGLLILIILLIFWYFNYAKRNNSSLSLSEFNSFTSSEIEILKKITSKGLHYEFNADDLNYFLDAEKKPIETQRQIRARFINNLNQKVEINFQLKEGIRRQKSSIDKRYTIYVLNEKLFEIIKQNLDAV
jgi:hypothetical protein